MKTNGKIKKFQAFQTKKITNTYTVKPLLVIPTLKKKTVQEKIILMLSMDPPLCLCPRPP